ncbi:MAG: DNA-deoxyinosine glycosylase [Elusimicrobiales bacterium]|nr:DNA-deoxyinosine glycosylase [Elusimicrobiales bacterium]
MIIHPIPPVYDTKSVCLILGSFPSVKSREAGFFYGHPRNRFWAMLAKILDEKKPETITEKKALLTRHGVALWDVIKCCEISGSSDSSIKNAVPNDIMPILEQSKIRKILINGGKAWELYQRHIAAASNNAIIKNAVKMPSTSPANAAWTLEKLIQAWEPEINAAGAI